ncbi:ATP-dependent helicase [Clostridium intestinale]|uniref:DNA 3'-5' helicase n=1 Tax=Clostridium intestinale DSM 6191 TaxID=1121320 RepID=A0A1M5WUM6_9CLOT|nr:ATP-dependent helicase [Clostridium intestinale]SHH91128.1 DNA helicase-2 / ATP-dependent DNA helicase PcrA [Clostridium intestinale DSM 6191]
MYKLDEFQIKAATSDERNLLVVAAPGSGKTTVIVNRVRYLIEEKGISAGNIIVITFTKSAAVNMKERYLKESIDKKAPFFGTFHGLFYKLLIRHLGKIDIISSTDTYRIIEKNLKIYIDDVSEDKVKEVLNAISLHKTSLGEVAIDDSIIASCFEQYELYKKEKDLLDFDDLQINMFKILSEDQSILDKYTKMFRCILVDEFQDCDSLQLKILKLLNKNNSVFCVGDEDQCIYSFRGSRPECMVNFHEEFNGRKVYLSYNYRSSKNIVDISKKLIENNKNRNFKEIINYRKSDGEIRLINPYSEKFQGEDIVNRIEEKYTQGIPLSTNVVIYRTNVEARSISDELIKRKIPFRFLDKEYNFFEHFICKDIIAYMKLAVDPYDFNSFKKIINKPFRYISKQNIDIVGNDIIKDNVFSKLINKGDLKSFQLNKIDRLKSDIAYLNKVSIMTALDYVLNDLEYREYIREYSEKFKISSDDIEIIIQELRTILTEFKTISLFLAHVELVKEELSSLKRTTKEDGVLLSTIHGVKGLEFESVYILNCCEEIIPHGNSKNIEEERRLFYVGITRAINNLYIYSPKTIRGKFVNSSVFLKELDYKEEIRDYGYKNGDKIMHKAYGSGIVKDISGDTIDIVFENGVERKFSLIVLVKNGIIG